MKFRHREKEWRSVTEGRDRMSDKIKKEKSNFTVTYKKKTRREYILNKFVFG